jgi:hypothetical protein
MFGWFKEQSSPPCRVCRSPRQPGDPIPGWLRLPIGTGDERKVWPDTEQVEG